MSRFSTPKEAQDAARKAAEDDVRRHKETGIDLNPFCTEGARNQWQRGYDNKGARSWEGSLEYDTIYHRGKAAALIGATSATEGMKC
jgi:hypothetical protein